MSGHGFHVHGPHDHAVEHAAHGNDPFSSRIAVMTAILATIGAMFGYQGGATQNGRGAVQEQRGDQEDRGVEPVELLPGEIVETEPGRAGHGDPGRRPRALRNRGGAL
jgi:hypothetical protein